MASRQPRRNKDNWLKRGHPKDNTCEELIRVLRTDLQSEIDILLEPVYVIDENYDEGKARSQHRAEIGEQLILEVAKATKYTTLGSANCIYDKLSGDIWRAIDAINRQHTATLQTEGNPGAQQSQRSKLVIEKALREIEVFKEAWADEEIQMEEAEDS